MDSISEARLGEVNPTLAGKVRQMAHMLELEGIIIRVTQGVRTWSEQGKLYAQGRETQGDIVTNAPPGHSYHNFGMAVDVAPFDGMGHIDWNSSHPVWQRIVAVGESVGLQPGAKWRSFPDYPHFQLTGKFPASPDDELRALFMDQGTQQVWKESGVDA